MDLLQYWYNSLYLNCCKSKWKIVKLFVYDKLYQLQWQVNVSLGIQVIADHLYDISSMAVELAVMW